MRRTAITVYVVFLIVVATVGVGAAADAGVLIPVTVPFAGVLIVALRILGPNPEQIGWAAFTGWLGLTYLQIGGVVEVVAFFVLVTLGALGLFRSSWYLAGAWVAHIPWDFLPRQLPEALVDVPVACVGFDGLVAVYLIWCSRTSRWTPFEDRIGPNHLSAT